MSGGFLWNSFKKRIKKKKITAIVHLFWEDLNFIVTFEKEYAWNQSEDYFV